MQKTLDKYLPKWIYYVLLALAVFYASYFNNMASVYSALSMFAVKDSSSLVVITNIIIVAFEVFIFEFIARIYYNYVSGKTGFKGLTCTKTQFVDILRIFYIFRCIALGSAYILVYYFSFLTYFASVIFSLLFSCIFYYLFFLYIRNKYINKQMGGKTFLHLAGPFLVYSVLVLFINLIA